MSLNVDCRSFLEDTEEVGVSPLVSDSSSPHCVSLVVHCTPRHPGAHTQYNTIIVTTIEGWGFLHKAAVASPGGRSLGGACL